jgi:predicted ATPase
MVDTHAERVCEAELYRLKGELLLKQESQKPVLSLAEGANVKGQMSKTEEAEECLQRALVIARSQRAKSWELRAAISLTRLWQNQGKKAKALQLLSEIHDWFTEGFDMVDLQAAKVLVEELNGG